MVGEDQIDLLNGQKMRVVNLSFWRGLKWGENINSTMWLNQGHLLQYFKQKKAQLTSHMNPYCCEPQSNPGQNVPAAPKISLFSGQKSNEARVYKIWKKYFQ